MAKAKKSKIVIKKATPPKTGNGWPFADLTVGTAFYVDPDEHQAARTAASRAKKTFPGWEFSVRKVKDKRDPEYGRIGIFRTK